MVEGTEVNFHCPNEESWYIDEIEVIEAILSVLNFTTSNETENLTITAGSAYIEEYSNISLIHCLQRGGQSLFVMLVISGKCLHQLC